ncbi:anthranilate synthase alpha subunit 1 chloroplastic [Phtheirospermum japonicum]|uniref:Anthranilate synthase alpha subunit 1 chloroplastic n=1 Tax=Phtheirospermum japonicum TaxID=374723 RepID=A0A830CWU9_9LAMI|nr:anthranilate synthase alpha subunit 1 chloroplastic [Phtheirospermum japonicum]
MEVVAKENKVTILDHGLGTMVEKIVDDPMTIPRSISEGWRPQLIQDLPEALCGRWVGFFSFDTVRYVEKKKLSFSNAPKEDRNLADTHLGLYDDVIVFDHVDKMQLALLSNFVTCKTAAQLCIFLTPVAKDRESSTFVEIAISVKKDQGSKILVADNDDDEDSLPPSEQLSDAALMSPPGDWTSSPPMPASSKLRLSKSLSRSSKRYQKSNSGGGSRYNCHLKSKLLVALHIEPRLKV